MFLLRALRLKGSFRIKAVDDLFKADASEKAVEAYIAKAYAASKLVTEPALTDLLKKTPDEIRAAKDPPGRRPGQDHGTAPVQHAVEALRPLQSQGLRPLRPSRPQGRSGLHAL